VSLAAASVNALVNGGLRTMFFGSLNRSLLVLVGGVFVCGILLHQHASSSQPRQDAQPPQSRPVAGPAQEKASIDRKFEIPAPREIKVAAGRGTALVYALDDRGERIPDRIAKPKLKDQGKPPSREEERELRWAVVTGTVEHRRIQESFGGEGREALLPARDLYRRVDLERQRLQEDGTWSAWEPIDFEATMRVLDNLPEVESEVTPEEVRIDALVDPLPFLKSGVWRGVDVERFVPPDRRNRTDRRIGPANLDPHPAGAAAAKSDKATDAKSPDHPLPKTSTELMIAMMRGEVTDSRNQLPPRAEPALLMMRSFDFSVESGRTYRYRARVVLLGRSRRSDCFGSWSETTHIVTIP
jgi:hypothetical protein